MVKLKNNRNITVTFEGLEIDPFGQILMTDEKWAELYKKREIRESVAINYLVATKQPDPKITTPETEITKNKRGK